MASSGFRYHYGIPIPFFEILAPFWNFDRISELFLLYMNNLKVWRNTDRTMEFWQYNWIPMAFWILPVWNNGSSMYFQQFNWIPMAAKFAIGIPTPLWNFNGIWNGYLELKSPRYDWISNYVLSKICSCPWSPLWNSNF